MSARRPLPVPASALLGASVAAGWTLHDLAVFAASHRPEEALELLGGSAVVLAAGALLGALLALRREVLWTLLALALVATLVPLLYELPLSRRALLLPRTLLLLLASWWIAARVAQRFRLGALPLGLAAGLVACALQTSLLQGALWSVTRRGTLLPVWPLVLSGLLGAAACRARGALLGRWVPALLWLAAGGWVARGVWPYLRMPRPDLAAAPTRADPSAPSLLLVVLDTVRADHLALYGSPRVTTPGLDAFVRERCTLFSSARSTSSWTLPSHASLFTGLFPSEHGVDYPWGSGAGDGRSRMFHVPPLPAERVTLAEELRERGYRTGAIVANNVLTHHFGLDQGFERYDDRPSGNVGNYLALSQILGMRWIAGHKPYRDARIITDLAERWLAADRRPFFLMLNYMDAHSPWIPPAPFDRAFGDEAPLDALHPREAALFPLLYDRSLLWLDSEVSRLLDGLRRDGRLDSTLVVITSDHGEALGEHGTWLHGQTLYEEVVHVPLFVQTVGRRALETRGDPIHGVELHALIRSELGLPARASGAAENDGLFGEWHRSGWTVAPVREGEAAGRRAEERDLVAWIQGGIKVVVASSGEVEAFDLARDPQELHPLELPEDERARARRRAVAWWEGHPPPAATARELDADTVERMRDLGYVGDQ